MNASRIVVIGTSGSGKTTLSKALAKKLGYNHIELDALHWEADWVEVDEAIFRARVIEAISDDSWTIDGNYAKARDLVWRRAELVIWLDYSFPVVFWRTIRRTFRRVVGREILWSGNRETWQMALLSKESILLWVIQTHSRRAKQFPILLQKPEYQHLTVVRHRTPRETEAWFKTIKPQHENAEA